MSTTLLGIVKGCTDNLGGLKKVYLIYTKDISSVATSTVEGGTQVTTITLPANKKFKNYEFPKDAASYTVTPSQDNLGITEYTHSLKFKIPRRHQAKHKEMLAIFQNAYNLTALVQDGNDLWWLLGYSYGLNLQNSSGGSGSNLRAGTNYEITLAGISDDFELNVDEDIIYGLH